MAADRRRLALEVAALLVVVALVVTFATRRRGGSDRHVDYQFMMGTIVSVTVLSPDDEVGRSAIESAFEEIARVEALTSGYSGESEISRLNSMPDGCSGKPVSREVADVIARALAVCEASSGAFDVTVAPLTALWPLSDEDFRVPDLEEVEEALLSIDWTAVRIDTAAGTLTMPPGTALDLAGVAKGYAVDLAAEALGRSGIETGVVDAGGDIGFVGAPPREEGWRVGIKDPRGEGILGVVTLSGGSVATSGDYQRYVVVDSVRYHHILDPSTGLPARGIMSVTVTSGRAVDADALATAVFVLGPEQGMELIERTAGAEALVVTGGGDAAGEVLVSSGLEGRFTREQ